MENADDFEKSQYRFHLIKLTENKILCKQASGDADRDIVVTAVTTVDFPGKK